MQSEKKQGGGDVIVDRQELRSVVHDLRGPMVSLKGFHSELAESVERIRCELKKWHGPTVNFNCDSLDSIVKEDLEPILTYMSMSISQMSERLKALEHCPCPDDDISSKES